MRNTADGDLRAAPGSSRALFVVPRGRADGFHASIRGHILELADPGTGDALAPTPDDLLVTSIASELAWSAQRLLRARGLPDAVSVSAAWQTLEAPPRPADITLKVRVPRRAGAMRATLAAAFTETLAARSLAGPLVQISLED